MDFSFILIVQCFVNYVAHVFNLSCLSVSRLRESLRRVDAEGVYMRRLRLHVLRRRQYSVPGPNALWHIDGNMLLKSKELPQKFPPWVRKEALPSQPRISAAEPVYQMKLNDKIRKRGKMLLCKQRPHSFFIECTHINIVMNHLIWTNHTCFNECS